MSIALRLTLWKGLIMVNEKIPQYFNDFKLENERQHGDLGSKIEKFKGDLTWRMVLMGGVVIGALTLVISL